MADEFIKWPVPRSDYDTNSGKFIFQIDLITFCNYQEDEEAVENRLINEMNSRHFLFIYR